ncbi:MAG: hypothetical protein ABIH23_15980 [bacterium]
MTTTKSRIFMLFIPLSIAVIEPLFAEDAAPAWWNELCNINKLQLPEREYCPGHYLITSLSFSGIPINVELYAVIKGKDIILTTSDFSEQNKVWKEVPPKMPWRKLPADRPTRTLADIVAYFCNEAGGYRIIFRNSLPVLLPEKQTALCERVHCRPYSGKGVSFFDIIAFYRDSFPAYSGPLSAGLHSSDTTPAEDVQFDITFPGGNLMELLCEMIACMNSADPQYSFCWEIGGTDDNRAIAFKSIPLEKSQALRPEK